MTSPQTNKNTIKITHDLSCIIMRNRAIMMIKMLKDKKNKYNKNKQTKV